jgi:hypothetical protein
MVIAIVSLFVISGFSVSFQTMEIFRLCIMRLIAECCVYLWFEYLRLDVYLARLLIEIYISS